MNLAFHFRGLRLCCDFYSFAALHEIEPAFKKFSSSEKTSSLMRSLGYKRPVIMQSMYIFKVHFLGLLCVQLLSC